MAPVGWERLLQGELVDFVLFDLGAEVALARVPRILGREPQPAPVVARSPAPTYVSFPQPLEVRFRPETSAEGGPTVEVRVHAVGVVAVRIRAPWAVEGLDELHGLEDRLWIGPKSFHDAAQEWFKALREELRPALVEPYTSPVAPETYSVFCVNDGIDSTIRFLRDQREAVAALVAGEVRDALVPEIADMALKHTIQYHPTDALVIGWDHAMVVGSAGSYEDLLDVVELSNLQLLEFRTYDAYLDGRLGASFQALSRLWSRGGLFRSARTALQDISQVRAEVARLTDHVHHTGKIFGDWYLAKVHQRLNERFHVASWERAVAAKMDTLEDLFHMAGEEANHRRSLGLEVMIIVLFVLDLVLIFMVGTN